MGLLFEMENDFREIKDKFFTRQAKRSPIDFKVALVKRDEPHMPTEDVNGFNAKTVSPVYHGIEVAYLNYDVMVKIGDVVMRMQLQEFMNLTNTLSNRANKFQTHVGGEHTLESLNQTLKILREREAGASNETIS